GLVYVSASAANSSQAVASALTFAEAGREVLVRTPAATNTPFALSLFEKHSALCFWSGGAGSHQPPTGPATLFAYLGSRSWEFSRIFRPHGVVFMRGFGAAGPWSCR
ncbi:MAG: hypothetical protein JWN04_4447, partial [Myxococcaceae bacterium]|nr:hypothetical protein [Myxococcaceae bacterium]